MNRGRETSQPQGSFAGVFQALFHRGWLLARWYIGSIYHRRQRRADVTRVADAVNQLVCRMTVRSCCTSTVIGW